MSQAICKPGIKGQGKNPETRKPARVKNRINKYSQKLWDITLLKKRQVPHKVTVQ